MGGMDQRNDRIGAIFRRMGFSGNAIFGESAMTFFYSFLAGSITVSLFLIQHELARIADALNQLNRIANIFAWNKK